MPRCCGVPIKTRIQYEIHTTRFYNTPIQQANQKLSRKLKLAFIEVIKAGIYIHKNEQVEINREQKTD